MPKKVNIYYISIVLGAVVAIYANANEEQNLLLLVGGIALLMFGIFNLQSAIPSKKEKDTFVESELIEDEEE
ncbi:hypothetical protein [Olleya sp. HaHaR_3_96]|uniref:hypothetical protein n=1 Tax=Olleya sp. HaHaR_3_96 TaxID=2745560 RepID=UPI001C501006|nr:hypothetical protein [Olleya sp. HaHaR_3_96]QXP59142.1 hypothetical protein H0I26_14620 [Olleya sp. HaHaR_3_96]